MYHINRMKVKQTQPRVYQSNHSQKTSEVSSLLNSSAQSKPPESLQLD